MLQNVVADVLDELAADFKAVARESTTGATESVMLGNLAKIFIKRAALRREADTADRDAAERWQAAQDAAVEAAAAESAKWDPATHSINEVNDYLRSASAEERDRVLQVEASDRPEVPAAKKQRAGILVTGPFGSQANA